MIRDRIYYTAQNLMVVNYDHQVQHILKYKTLCCREDVFQVMMMIAKTETEEEYLAACKRFVSFVKLIAPEIIEYYEIEEKVNVYFKLISYDAEVNYYHLRDRRFELRKECEQHV